MKYIIESLVNEYVSCSADLFLARKSRLPSIVFRQKGQGVIFNSAKEFEPYARGFNGLAQLNKIVIKVESNGPEPKRDIEVTLADVHHFKPGNSTPVNSQVPSVLQGQVKGEVKPEPKKEKVAKDKLIIPKLPEVKVS